MNFNFFYSSSDKENPKKLEEATKKEKKESNKESPYANIPNDMYYCHLCNKHMWDALSFENHLKGRTHQMMKEGIEESYRLKANMIRQEAKIAEQLKAIEIDRLKRLGKTIRASNQLSSYCIMCDLHFYGHLSTHRKSDGHLSLKKFLHPKCNDCNYEFHNRSEYDEHLLSPSHLRNSKTKPTSKSEERKKNQLHILKEADELQGLREENKKKEKKKTDKEDKSDPGKSDDGTAENGQDKSEAMETEDVDKKEDEEEDEQPTEESVDVILDYIDGLTQVDAEIDTKLPKYNCNRPVASSMIHKLECFECRLCVKYLDTEKTAEIHSRTTSHHRNFLKFLNEKSNETKIAQKRAAAAFEENERKKIKTESDDKEKNGDLYDPEAAGDDEENNTVYLDADDIKGEITEGETTFEEATSNGHLNDDENKKEDSPKKDDEKDVSDDDSKSGSARNTRRRTRAAKF